MPAYSSISPLIGAIRFNRSLAVGGQLQDPGGKIATLISAINVINTNLSLIQIALMSANASAGFSSLSGVTFTSTFASLGNFTNT